MGFATVKAVLEADKPIVDISFFEEDPFLLDELATSRGLTAIVDCGIAPGCGNIILGYHASLMDRVERFLCLVGGLPTVRTWPYEYKAPFSPSDVIEEYTRPARYVAHGEVVTLPALSEPELMDFPGVGTLEAFNTDGLRTLLHTVEAPFKKEKTLRYPGHIEKMRVMRETGLFSKEPVELRGAKVVPLELTSKLLFHLWKFEEGEEDLTVMRVEVEGVKDGQRACATYDLLDRYEASTGTLSMARTTGYTCTAVVRAYARGLYRKPGISPPEYLGKEPGVYEFVMRELAARGRRLPGIGRLIDPPRTVSQLRSPASSVPQPPEGEGRLRAPRARRACPAWSSPFLWRAMRAHRPSPDGTCAGTCGKLARRGCPWPQ